MARLDDGFSTLITFGSNSSATIHFFEKTVTPPGIDGGGEIDTTTMHNTTWRTRSPKKLKTLAGGETEVAYDTAILTAILAQIQVNQQITVHFPDGHTYTFWGFLDSFIPAALKEGEQPTATIKIIPTNHDNSQVEQAPVYA